MIVNRSASGKPVASEIGTVVALADSGLMHCNISVQPSESFEEAVNDRDRCGLSDACPSTTQARSVLAYGQASNNP